MNKILLYGWGALGEEYTVEAFRQNGYEVIVYKRKVQDYDLDSQVSMELMTLIHQKKPDYLFSIDYFPLISSIAQTCMLPYLTWIYDSPHNTLYSKTVGYRGNYIFVFDQKLCKDMEARGITRAYSMPLGVDYESIQQVIHAALPKERSAYQAEVSFVGRFYADRYNEYDKLEHMEKENHEKARRLVAQQKFCYGTNLIGQTLQEQNVLAEAIVQAANLELGPMYERCPQNMAAALLGRQVTAEERRELLEAVSEHFSLAVYTDSDIADLSMVENRGTVDYLSEMPLVFHESKINLNITLRTIESGIPLRALDIMASGGFLLSNYQPELAEWFADGDELVLFHSKEDCLAKIEYYLAHEDERCRIAQKGEKKVKEQFLLRHQCSKIMEKAGCMEERIECMLAMAKPAAYEKLAGLCQTEDFLQQARRNNSFAQLKVLCDIFMLEKRAGISRTVLSNCISLQQADAYFTALKFFIHRIEFGLPEELQKELEVFLQNTNTSRYALMLIANQVVYSRKKEIGIRLSEIAGELGRQEDILPLLLWGMTKEEGRVFLEKLQENHV